MIGRCKLAAALAVSLLAAPPAMASSHREAPGTARMPEVDATDFYMFRSYEAGRAGFVTFIACYNPLQDPYGGPNYYSLSDDALYEIHIDNDGDAFEDLTFRFRFTNTFRDIAIPVGDGPPVAVPLVNVGPVTADDMSALNRLETFQVELLRYPDGKKRRAKPELLTDFESGATSFRKPMDNIGEKTFPDYEAYARTFIRDIRLPGTDTPGRIFVGQRKDPFVVNLGETFDLVNIANPIGDPDIEHDSLFDKNITSIVLEVPISYLVDSSSGPIFGGWTTASLRRNRTLFDEKNIRKRGEPEAERGKFVQVSRLSNPLVNEVVIGLPDKNLFNASHPSNDAQFLRYVTNPTLPELVETLFFDAGVRAPNLFPRTDLVAAFLTGVEGLNQTDTPAEMLRMNCTIPPTPPGMQNPLGVIGGDNAGFPNGRRPGDDVVDIALQVMMGRLINLGLYGEPGDAPSGNLPFTDGAYLRDTFFDISYPYLRPPIPGSRFDD